MTRKKKKPWAPWVKNKQAVYVLWKDITTDGDWLDELKGLEPIDVVTLGFIVEEKDDHIVVAQTISADEGGFGRVAIPKILINDIWKLK